MVRMRVRPRLHISYPEFNRGIPPPRGFAYLSFYEAGEVDIFKLMTRLSGGQDQSTRCAPGRFPDALPRAQQSGPRTREALQDGQASLHFGPSVLGFGPWLPEAAQNERPDWPSSKMFQSNLSLSWSFGLWGTMQWHDPIQSEGRT